MPRLLSTVLQRLLHVSKTHLENQSLDATIRDTEYSKQSRTISIVEHQTAGIRNEIERQMKLCVVETLDKLCNYLQEDNVIKKMTLWEEDECPNIKYTQHLFVRDIIMRAAGNRVKRSIGEWEADSRVFCDFQQGIDNLLKDRYASILDEIRINDLQTSSTDLVNDPMRHVKFTVDALLEVTSSVGIPLALIVDLLEIPDTKLDSVRSYITNKPYYMSIATTSIINTIIQKDTNKMEYFLTENLSRNLRPHCDLIEQLHATITADKVMIMRLQNDTDVQKSSVDNLCEVVKHATTLLGKVSLFYAQHLKVYDFQKADIANWNETTDAIAEGHFTKTFRTKTEEQSSVGKMNVTIKFFKQTLDESVATEFLSQEDTLR